jgi:uncharacterized protein YcfJ
MQKSLTFNPSTKNVRCYEPAQECHYERRAVRGNNTTAIIFGSLLDGAIDHKLAHKKSNKRVGAVARAILAGSIANDATHKNRSHSGAKEQICTTTQQVGYHVKFTDYKVAYRYRGKN